MHLDLIFFPAAKARTLLIRLASIILRLAQLQLRLFSFQGQLILQWHGAVAKLILQVPDFAPQIRDNVHVLLDVVLHELPVRGYPHLDVLGSCGILQSVEGLLDLRACGGDICNHDRLAVPA